MKDVDSKEKYKSELAADKARMLKELERHRFDDQESDVFSIRQVMSMSSSTHDSHATGVPQV